jgi:hypothetical protein
MVRAMVVTETEDFEHHVEHENVVWVNNNLGRPQLHNCRYLAPMWIANRSVNRIYHI